MTIRCKFRVDAITRSIGLRQQEDGVWRPQEMRTVKLCPVSGGSEENKKFWNATPSGSFEFGTVNAEAVNALELGGEYYIDISPAPKGT